MLELQVVASRLSLVVRQSDQPSTDVAWPTTND
jgi:hypothetical protein